MTFATKRSTLSRSATKTAEPKTIAASEAAPISKKKAVAKDAIALLKADHLNVNSLFEDYEKTSSVKKKKAIVAEICTALTVHTQIEEEIFYPAFKAALKDKELVPEAVIEHATVKDLIAQVEGLEPDGEVFDAKIKVLSEYIKHHVKEEQTEMFPKAKSSSLDMAALGERMAARKSELLTERGGS